MYKILLILFFSILLVSGCGDNSNNDISKSWDSTPPDAPKTIFLDNNSSAKYSKVIEIRGEAESAVIVNGEVLAQLDENGYAKVNIPLKGEDGLKSVKVELEDAYGNRSKPVIIKIYKDTTAPVITLNGDNKIYITLNHDFTDSGAKAVDNLDGEVAVKREGSVDIHKSGRYVLTYKAYDRAGNSASVNRIVYVQANSPINHAPKAKDDTLTLNEDTNKTVDVLGNDSDADGDTLSIKSFTQAKNGLVSKVAGKLQYTPKANYNGSDSFKYTITDGEKTSTATVSVTVNPVNDTPTLEPISDITLKDTDSPKEIILQASDVDSQNLTYKVSSVNSNYFSIAINANMLTITPKSLGESSVSVSVSDESGAIDTKSFKVKIVHTNLAPEYQNSLNDINTQDAQTLYIDISNSVKDPEGEVLKYSIEGLPQGLSIDTVTNKISGTLSNLASSNSPYIIKVTATDPEGLSTQATFNLLVSNPSPIAKDDNITLNEDATVTVDALKNDSDPDGDAITLKEIKTAPANGLAKVENGKIVYTPDRGFYGNDSLVYEIQDSQNAIAQAKIDLNIIHVNHAPKYSGNLSGMDFNDSQSLNIDISQYFSDEDNDSLIFSASNLPENLSINQSSGVISGTLSHDASINSPYIVSIQAKDSSGKEANASFKIYVTNIAPTANDDNVTLDEDKNSTIDVLSNDSDLDGDSVSIKELAIAPINGIAKVENGKIVYIPNPNYNGKDTLTYTITDGDKEANGTVNIIVIPVNDAPIVKLEGNKTVTLNAGDNYVELGATAYDIEDGNISDKIVIDSSVDTAKAGFYTVKYSVKDSNGQISNEVIRNVHVLLKVFDFPAMKQIALDKNFTRPSSLKALQSYKIRLAKGEYHSIAMLIEPEGNQTKLTAENDNFTSSNGSLDKRIMDTYIAKRWFQAGDVKPGHETMSMYNYKINGKPTTYYNHKWLTQELLLKDEKLVQVDFAKESNKLRVKDRATGKEHFINISSRDDDVPDTTKITFDDAKTLQPFELVKNQHKLLWSTIHIPKDAKSTIYKSTFRIKNSNGDIVKSVPIEIEVLPFALDKSKLRYGIYYTARRFDSTPRIDTAIKTKAKHKLLLENLKEHGVMYPTTYFEQTEDFRTDLEMRKELGFPTDRVYTLGAGLFRYINKDLNNSDTINQIVNKIKDFKNIYSEEGYATGGLYVYGFDEPAGDNIQKEIDAIRKIRESVDINFFATGGYRHYSAEGIVDDVDLLVYPRYTLDKMILRRDDNSNEWKYAIDASKYIVNLWHEHDKKMYIYNAPQGGVESAEVYRKNFGVRLWKDGSDGAMDWGYQYGRVFIWNDFLSTGYRDETFIYPTTNGVINTIEWEGYRQAITDVRYLSTLSNLRDNLSGNAQKEIDDFLNSLDPSSDLDLLREKMIDLILKYGSYN